MTATHADSPAEAPDHGLGGRTALGLHVQRQGAALRLTLDRPAQHNALDVAMAQGIVRALTAAAGDPGIRAIVLTGAGRAFCAGGDFAGGPEVWRRNLEEGHFAAVRALLELPKPVVARVNGLCFGAGLDLALACDLRITTERAPIGAVAAYSGAAEGTLLLPRLIGLARAQELLFLGRKISGARAAALGLFHRAVPEAQLDAAVAEVVDRLVQGPTAILGLLKGALRDGFGHDWQQALAIEMAACRASLATRDSREAYEAYLAGRPPRFSGS